MMRQNIAVIGAGPMGLAVAYQLVKEGHQPVIFEADDRIGGMAATFDFDGISIERYYHFHCTSDNAFLQLLEELGILGKMCWVETKMGYWYRGILQPWGNPIALLKFKGLSLLAKFRYGLHAFLSIKRKEWKELDGIKASAWIKSSVGTEAYEVLWEKLLEYKFYNYSNNLSAAWIWSRIHRIGNSRYSMMREKLGYLEGGSETLLVKMREYIVSKGGEIYLNSPVSHVTIEDGVVKGVEVKGVLVKFDKVVSTIPLPYIPEIIPDLPSDILKKFKSIKNISVICVVVKLNKAVTDNFWLNINDSSMDIPGLVEYTNLRPLDGEHIVYVPYYVPGNNQKFFDSDELFIEKVKKYLKIINPTLKNENFIELYVSRYRYAQPICPPKYLESLPPVDLPINGLWVADTSYYYPEDRGISESINFGKTIAKKLLS